MRLFRLLGVLLIGLGLLLNGVTSHSYAAMSAASGHAAHNPSHVEKYADLAIDAEDCPHAAAHDTANSPAKDAPCKSCCSACMTATLLPPPFILLGGQMVTRHTFTQRHVTLVANVVPTDPDIPKST